MKPMPKLYTIPEAARILRVTRQTIYNWSRAGKLSMSYVNGRPRVEESELAKLVERTGKNDCEVTQRVQG